MKELVVFLATGFGLGNLRPAPGTWGTLVGLPIVWALSAVSLPMRIAITIGLVAVGVPICDAAAREMGAKDPSSVVWDEFATLPIVFLPLATPLWSSWMVLALGFVLHRVFDISKCPPVNLLERLPGGWGIMMDDVVAALYAAACLWIIVNKTPLFEL